jgi:hypothetical protein
LIINLVNEAKPGAHLYSLFSIGIVKENTEGNIVGTTLITTVREVLDAPLMASYHERPRRDHLAVGYVLYGTRVVFDHK